MRVKPEKLLALGTYSLDFVLIRRDAMLPFQAFFKSEILFRPQHVHTTVATTVFLLQAEHFAYAIRHLADRWHNGRQEAMKKSLAEQPFRVSYIR